MGRLDNRVALITGAVGAIGAATARIMAKEGADLVISDMTDKGGEELATELRAIGRKVQFTVIDVTDRASVAAGVKAAEREFGRIDILVNNAGISTYGTIDTITDAVWKKIIDVNLTGVFLCSQIVVE